MDEDTFKKLDKLRVDIAGSAFQAQVLFKTIIKYETNNEITALSELGMSACKQIRENGEKLEFAIDEIKNLD